MGETKEMDAGRSYPAIGDYAIIGDCRSAALIEFVRRGGRLDRTTSRMLGALGKTVCRRWSEPDEGIWEARSGRRHHTYSKAMCWVALDRLLRLHAQGLLDVPVHAFTRERDAIRTEIEARGYNEHLGSYVSVLDGEDVDASLLLLARYGYAEPASPRMRATCESIRHRLGANGLLYRYRGTDDGTLDTDRQPRIRWLPYDWRLNSSQNREGGPKP